MASKLVGNGMFEASRLILPEHREAILAQEREQKRRGKPFIDEQQMEEIERAIIESYNRRCIVEMVVFNPFYDEDVKGIVVSLNTATYEVKLKLGEGYRHIKIAEIISANV